MEMWRRNLEDQSDKEDIEPPTILELDEETIHDPLMPNLQAYREAIFKSPSYEWLTGSLRRDFLLIPADPDCMEIIRKEIAHAFPSSRQVSRKKVAGDFYVAFQVGWDPLAFIAEQEYPAQPGDSVLNALTITGPNTEAQALPCSQYIYQTWSVTGKLIMKFLGRVASDARGGRMTRHTASGTVDSLVEIGQQLGWLGAALRSSPFETGMAFSLIDANRVNVFDGKVFIKGFSSMLIPAKKSGDLLIWHLLCNKHRERISYIEKTGEHERKITVDSLERFRHVVGWCSDATYHAGAADASYNIERSRLPLPHAGCVLEKCSISGGQFITGGVSVVLGNRDKPVRISRQGYIRKLEWISKKFVVLWDEGDKRGWLVNGTSALLHLVRASLEQNRTGKFRSAYIFSPDQQKLPHRGNACGLETITVAGKLRQCNEYQLEPVTQPSVLSAATNSALEVLVHPQNRKLKIYDESGENANEDNHTIVPTQRMERSYYCFQDRVEQLSDSLEKMIDHEINANSQQGVKVKLRARTAPRRMRLQRPCHGQ